MKKLLLILVFLSSNVSAYDATQISNILSNEWTKFENLVKTLEPAGDVGGYLNYVNYGDSKILWRISDDDSDRQVIRFYLEGEDGVPFTISYYKTDDIVDGHMVVRRFIKTGPTSWINHTIDFESGDYLGSQGWFPIDITKKEEALMDLWGITPIE